LGVDFVAGRNLVPRPATGMTAFCTFTRATVLAAWEGCQPGTGPWVHFLSGMPTYEYTCRDCGHTFEIVQSMLDEALTMCPECGGSLRKVFAAPAISFKGSGFYATDHGKKAKTHGESKKSGEQSGEPSENRKEKTKESTGSKDSSSGSSGEGSKRKPSTKEPAAS
jgi:putative FmdB family regulatory protein